MLRSTFLQVGLLVAASGALVELEPACNSGDGKWTKAAPPGQWSFSGVDDSKYLYLQVNDITVNDRDPMYLRVRVPLDTDFGELQIQYNQKGGKANQETIDFGYSENRKEGYYDFIVAMPKFLNEQRLNCKSEIRMQSLTRPWTGISVAIGNSLSDLGQCTCDRLRAKNNNIPLCGSNDYQCLEPCAGVTSAGTCGAVTHTDLTFPSRVIFHYPWFPQTWSTGGKKVKYQPDLGYYSSTEPRVVDRHIGAMDYAKIDLAVWSWWGIDTLKEKIVTSMMLDRTLALGSNVKWAPYYEKEGFSNQDSSLAALTIDLKYLKERYASHPAFATVDGKPVVFVWNVNQPNCDLVDKYRKAGNGEWYVVFKTFDGFEECTGHTKTDGSWHQYGVGSDGFVKGGDYSVCIGAGFWKADEAEPRVPRDITRFKKNVKKMVDSPQPWHMIVSLSEWGEGTAIEPAKEWASESGWGLYLDALHFDGQPTSASSADANSGTPSTDGQRGTRVKVDGNGACDWGLAKIKGFKASCSECAKWTDGRFEGADADCVFVPKEEKCFHRSFAKGKRKTVQENCLASNTGRKSGGESQEPQPSPPGGEVSPAPRATKPMGAGVGTALLLLLPLLC